MDRKIKPKNHHYDKPGHQRWLYKLSDMPFFKFWLLLWAVVWLCVAASLLLVKLILAIFK